ncbi:MAG: hypothetical protein H6993_18085 [Pseudomonadales bacterium]|nr:hypothetical protein [Pseudomonadales bacterium]MCP5185880.1 hypothetical protein [Pseudomonadales bacterium]
MTNRTTNQFASAERRSYRLGLPALMASLTLAQPACAAWDVYPLASLEAGYSDNVQLRSKGTEEGGNSITAEGSLVVRNAQETSNTTLELTGKQTHFSSINLDDATSATLFLHSFKRGERVTYGAVASFDSQTLLRNGVVDLRTGEFLGSTDAILQDGSLSSDISPDPNLDYGVVEESSQRSQIYIAPYSRFTLSERTNLDFTAEYTGTRYDNKARASGMIERDTVAGTAQLSYQLTERNRISTSVRAGRTTSENEFDFDQVNLLLGWNRTISPNSYWLVEGGIGRAETDENLKATTTIVRAEYSTRTPRSRFRAFAERNTYPAGQGDLVVADRVEAQFRHQLTERWDWRLIGRGEKTNSDLSGNNSGNYKYLEGETSLAYQLSPNWEISGKYRFRWRDRNSDPEKATGHAAYVVITYAPRRPF